MTWALGIAGGVVSAAGQMLSAYEQMRTHNINAREAKLDADLARISAAVDIDAIEAAGEATRSTQRAITAAQGTRTDEGSPLVLAMSAAKQERKASLRRKFVGEVAAMGFEREAEEEMHKAKTALAIGIIGAAGTALSGAGAAMGEGGGRGFAGTK